MGIFNRKKYLSSIFIMLTIIGANVFADVTLEDSALNLKNVKMTTLIDLNNPKTRPAYSFLKIEKTGAVHEFLADENSVNALKLQQRLIENKELEIGDIVYAVELDMKTESFNARAPFDILLSKNTSYKILASEAESSYHYLVTEPVFDGKSNIDNPDKTFMGKISLYIFASRFIVVKHNCSKEDEGNIKKQCKGRKSILTFDHLPGEFSIREFLGLLRSTIYFDLSTIPRLEIPSKN